MPGGRPRKPTALKEAEGNRGKRKLNPDPEFQKGVTCPKHLTGIARTKFMELAAALDALSLVEKPDAAALEGACIAYERAVKADNILRRQGVCLKQKNTKGATYTAPHPAIQVSKIAWEQYRRFCTEFGLTPASRSRLAAKAAEKPQRVSDFLSANPMVNPSMDVSALQ